MVLLPDRDRVASRALRRDRRADPGPGGRRGHGRLQSVLTEALGHEVTVPEQVAPGLSPLAVAVRSAAGRGHRARSARSSSSAGSCSEPSATVTGSGRRRSAPASRSGWCTTWRRRGMTRWSCRRHGLHGLGSPGSTSGAARSWRTIAAHMAFNVVGIIVILSSDSEAARVRICLAECPPYASRGGDPRVARFPSDPWFQEFIEAINGSERYREVAADWEGDVAFRSRRSPTRACPRRVGLAGPVARRLPAAGSWTRREAASSLRDPRAVLAVARGARG